MGNESPVGGRRRRDDRQGEGTDPPAPGGSQDAVGRALRMYAAQALGRLGPEAEPAAADLAEALKEDNEGVRTAAAEALKRIRPR